MKPRNPLTITILFVTTVLLNGCATTRTDLTKAGVVSIVPMLAKKAGVQSAHVSRTNGDITISGNIKFHPQYRCYGPGHVDIIILNQDSSVRTKTTARTRHRHRPRIDSRPSSYFVRIPFVPEDGSVIQIRYHAGGVRPECNGTQG